MVDRRLTSGRAAEFRARDIVRRHGASTLDYFALRSDKRWFFHRDTLVAYAVYGGVCLISPDPIGPPEDRAQAWSAFRRFADSHGWVTAVMGAGEEWLPFYRDAGMHHIYLGDEAVVQVQSFSLAGGHMKGLRQAHNRIKKYGYTVTFHDPGRITPALIDELTALMQLSRQGEHERGFSMMLGRIFDPRGLRPAAHRGARTRRQGGRHVPVRASTGNPWLSRSTSCAAIPPTTRTAWSTSRSARRSNTSGPRATGV